MCDREKARSAYVRWTELYSKSHLMTGDEKRIFRKYMDVCTQVWELYIRDNPNEVDYVTAKKEVEA